MQTCTIGAVAHSGRFYFEDYLQFGITDINCTGTEQDISSCAHNERRYHNCEREDDAGVTCQGIALCHTLRTGQSRLAC